MPPQGGILQVALEALHIEAERSRDLAQGLLVDRRLARVERVVHFPEAPLAAGGLRPDGHELGARVGALVRKMPEYVDHALAQRAPQALEHVPQPPAVGAKVVTVNEDREQTARGITATDVVLSWIDRPQEPMFASWRAHGWCWRRRVTVE